MIDRRRCKTIKCDKITKFYLDQFGLDFPVRGKLLMSKHVLLAFRQSLLTGG